MARIGRGGRAFGRIAGLIAVLRRDGADNSIMQVAAFFAPRSRDSVRRSPLKVNLTRGP
jgi:hypothetical protein